MLGVGASAVVPAVDASAQGGPTALPGLVVTVPLPDQQPPPPPQAAPARPAAKAPAPKSTTPSPAKAKAPTATAGGDAGGGGRQSILLLVNDDPVTGFELEERARLNSLQANINERASAEMQRLIKSEDTNLRWRKIVEETVQQNQGKTREQILAILEQRKSGFAQSLRDRAVATAKAGAMAAPEVRTSALNELIEERVKLQEAKRLNIVIDDKDVDGVIKSIADRNKVTVQQFAAQIKAMGSDISVMRQRFQATLAWNEVVRRKFNQQVTVSSQDVERYVSQGSKGEDHVELQISRVIIPLTSKVDQASMAQRMDQGEALRREFKSCKTLAPLIAKVPGARLEELPARLSSELPDPQRTLLLNAEVGEMLPPLPGPNGLDLFAVCARTVKTAKEAMRTEALSDLRQQDFERRARGALRELTETAHYDCRDPLTFRLCKTRTSNVGN
jgi:peptidyl-prolyl cis-trans isomerase SurA